MTVGVSSFEKVLPRIGQVHRAKKSFTVEETTVNCIRATLKNIPDVFAARGLKSNQGMCFQGVVPAGEGFKLADAAMVGGPSSVIRPYMIGENLTERLDREYIVDFFGLSESEAEDKNAEAFSLVLSDVKPERDQNPRPAYRRRWWIFAEPRPALRKAIEGLERYIATPYTAVHRPFVFLDSAIVPDAMIYVVPSSDGYFLGVLSSKLHTVWCRYAGGTLQDRPRYNSNRTFFPFPFPDIDDEDLKATIRRNAEKLDFLRKRVIARNADLTMTKLYNCLNEIRAAEASGNPLSDHNMSIARRGCVALMQRYHDRIDEAVCLAYKWPSSLSDWDILEQLIELNRSRASDEAIGNVMLLNEERQILSQETIAEQESLELDEEVVEAPQPTPWPISLPEQVVAVASIVQRASYPISAAEVAQRFMNKRTRSVQPVLDALAEMGSLRKLEDGRFAA